VENEIQKCLEDMEAAFTRAAHKGRRAANLMEKWADDNGTTAFARAPGIGHINAAVGKAGEGLLEANAAHKEAMKYDPRPQPRDGGGK
jgi:hypothetical protein